MELTLNRISPENQKNPPASMKGVVFGTVFSNHMFSMVWDDGIGSVSYTHLRAHET